MKTVRSVFNSIREMAVYMFDPNGNGLSKQTPYRVDLNGQIFYAFGGNSDQAIATVIRNVNSVKVTSVSIRELVSAKEEGVLPC